MKRYILIIILGLVLVSPVLASTIDPIQFIGGEVAVEVEQQGLALVGALENRGFAFAMVALAGLVDGTNVCGITLMLLMIGYLSIHIKNRKRAMKIGFIFLLTIFMSYFWIGVALSSVVKSLLHWQYYETLRIGLNYTIISILALAGILNIQDFFFSRKFVFSVGTKERKMFREYLEKIDVSGTIGVGILGTLFLLPCSLPIYLGSISVLTQEFVFAHVVFYIFIYSLMFVLPLLVLLSVILRAERVVSDKDIRSERFVWLKLIKGIIQLGVAYGIFLLF